MALLKILLQIVILVLFSSTVKSAEPAREDRDSIVIRDGVEPLADLETAEQIAFRPMFLYRQRQLEKGLRRRSAEEKAKAKADKRKSTKKKAEAPPQPHYPPPHYQPPQYYYPAPYTDNYNYYQQYYMPYYYPAYYQQQ